MDVQKAMKLALQSQARHDAEMQEIRANLREVTQKQSKNETLVHQNETLVHQLTLLVSQLADRQAKQFRQLTDAQKKTDAQLQKLIRSMVSSNGRKRSA